jgi:ABC-type amino acid transport system permease subunit
MPEPEQPSIEPVQDDGVRAITVGLVLFAVAGVVLLLQRDALEERGAQWWLWTVLVGLVIGVGLLAFTKRRAAVYREHWSEDASADAGPETRTESDAG